MNSVTPASIKRLAAAREVRRAACGFSSGRGVLAPLDGHEPGIRAGPGASVVRLQRDVLDQATGVGQLEPRGYGLTAALQEAKPLTELSTDHRNVLSRGARSGAFYRFILGARGWRGAPC